MDRPNCQRRRLKGKSRKTPSRPPGPPSGDACGEAKTRDGSVESMPVLRVAVGLGPQRADQALNQTRNLVSTAPKPIRDELRGLNVYHLLERASAYRPGAKRERHLADQVQRARRAITLEEEISEIDTILKPLVKETVPELVGTRIGRTPRRRSSSQPATIPNDCAAKPPSAVHHRSGKNQRHRLNRSG